jgi:hydrogenase-4 membrane subunit HyfE
MGACFFLLLFLILFKATRGSLNIAQPHGRDGPFGIRRRLLWYQLIVEFGILFDVLVAVILLGLLVTLIQRQFVSADTAELRRSSTTYAAGAPTCSCWAPAATRESGYPT